MARFQVVKTCRVDKIVTNPTRAHSLRKTLLSLTPETTSQVKEIEISKLV